MAGGAPNRPALLMEASKWETIPTIDISATYLRSLDNILPNTVYSLVNTINRKTKIAKLYINGILNNQITLATSTAVDIPGNRFRLMSYGNGTDTGVYGTSFNGIMYNAKMYNRELTLDEIKQNYANDRKRFGI